MSGASAAVPPPTGVGGSTTESSAAYDPLAAMMAPPSRSIPKSQSYGQISSAPGSGGPPPSIGNFAMPPKSTTCVSSTLNSGESDGGVLKEASCSDTFALGSGGPPPPSGKFSQSSFPSHAISKNGSCGPPLDCSDMSRSTLQGVNNPHNDDGVLFSASVSSPPSSLPPPPRF